MYFCLHFIFTLLPYLSRFIPVDGEQLPVHAGPRGRGFRAGVRPDLRGVQRSLRRGEDDPVETRRREDSCDASKQVRSLVENLSGSFGVGLNIFPRETQFKPNDNGQLFVTRVPLRDQFTF